ncbi:sensor histidine kinase [Carnobacterium gallinarum]|uniref:sensor histidine kinase n=1 Tax=Carnobacterium gallinarum TaxID=2749 RepID=UPI000B0DC7CB|nr:HAMP domain-containing sensor histidine kinase [Carnobacterium gallinarum]
MRKQINQLSLSLKTIATRSTNERLRLTSGQKELAELIRQINQQLDKEQEARLLIDEEALLLKQAMTNMSHDLRTPLTSILGYLKLAEKKNTSLEEQQRYLDVVKSKTINLQYLIEQFFELSRIESKILEVSTVQIEVTTILQDVLASYYEDFIQKQIVPNIKIPEHLVWAIGDTEALRRIFNNLLQNMLKHNASSVFISIEENFSKEKVTFILKNHADNLKQEDISQLFNRFYTADRMRSGQNTGLGLTIVKELVTKMNGEIFASLEEQNLVIQIDLLMKNSYPILK